MKKTVLPLAIVALVLVGLVMMRNAGDKETSIVEQVQLKRLTPDNMTQADIARVELYAGNDMETKLILARDAANANDWKVVSHYDAPIKEDKITTFLEELEELRGELRTTAADETGLADYALGEEEALHVAAYGKDSDEALFHVLVGKSPDYRSVFMRPEGSLDVFVEDSNLRSTAGLYGEELKAPEADPWLDKVVLAYAKEDITGVDLKTPNKSLSFKLETPEQPEQPEPAEGEDPPPPTPPAMPEWKVVAGGPRGLPHKQQGLDTLLGKLSNLTAASIVDPANLEEYGLDNPSFSCTITLANQETPVTIEAARKDPEGAGYVRMAGIDGAQVYEIAKYNFDGLFPKGSSFFDLNKETIAGEVDSLIIEQPEGRVALRKQEGGGWVVDEPAVPLDVQTVIADAAASALKSWVPADYADQGTDAGLDASTRKVTFTASGQTHTLALGKDSIASGGAYANVEGSAYPLVMGQNDVDKIFKTPKEFFQLALIDARDDEIIDVAIQQDDAAITIAREGGAWSVMSGGAPLEGELDNGAIDDLVVELAGLQASDIAFGKTALEGESTASLVITAEGDRTYTVQLGADVEDGREALVAGIDQVFHISSEDLANILIDPASLLVDSEPEDHDHGDDVEDDHDHSDGEDHGHVHESDDAPE